MSTNEVKGCINCAYLQEENGRMWCPMICQLQSRMSATGF